MIVELNQKRQDDKPIGMHQIPKTGRQFYWTGKVAIGIAHERPMPLTTQGEELIQRLWNDNK